MKEYERKGNNEIPKALGSSTKITVADEDEQWSQMKGNIWMWVSCIFNALLIPTKNEKLTLSLHYICIS
jgi:hypothetical protein